MQNVHGQQSADDVAQIKQEDDCETIQTIAVDDTSMHLPQQKIHLSSRVEIHRVIKRQGAVAVTNDKDVDAMNNGDGSRNSFVAPPLLSLAGPSAAAAQSLANNVGVGGSYACDLHQEQFHQRVHVIKDGRYYDESHHTDGGQLQPPQSRHREQSPPMPPLLPVQQSESPKRGNSNGVPSRQVIVNANSKSISDSRDSMNVVFRPPVVSSSCTPMRPPPPPPPPKLKANASEEPSSSIPDLGKWILNTIFPPNRYCQLYSRIHFLFVLFLAPSSILYAL